MTQQETTTETRGAFVIPAYNAGPLLRQVIVELEAAKSQAGLGAVPILIVNDGCTDESLKGVEELGVDLVHHETNQGKGAALQTAFERLIARGFDTCVTLDADAQHPAAEAVRLYQSSAPIDHLVLAVRDLKRAGAPRPNQLSNAFSNWVLSLFGGEELLDTQCGLRRYPLKHTVALGASHSGYPFESEIVLRAARLGLPIAHVPSAVHYPEESKRVSHFDSVRDPTKNVIRVVKTTLSVPHHRPFRRWSRRALGLALVLGLTWSARGLFT